MGCRAGQKPATFTKRVKGAAPGGFSFVKPKIKNEDQRPDSHKGINFGFSDPER
jgi:hypothetical protein